MVSTNYMRSSFSKDFLETKNIFEFSEILLKKLPQGSGFDCNWELLKIQKNGKYVFFTDFHCMNNDGYYDGYQRIKIYVDPFDFKNFRLTLSGNEKYRIDKDYYKDTIHNCLSEIGKYEIYLFPEYTTQQIVYYRLK